MKSHTNKQVLTSEDFFPSPAILDLSSLSYAAKTFKPSKLEESNIPRIPIYNKHNRIDRFISSNKAGKRCVSVPEHLMRDQKLDGNIPDCHRQQIPKQQTPTPAQRCVSMVQQRLPLSVPSLEYESSSSSEDLSEFPKTPSGSPRAEARQYIASNQQSYFPKQPTLLPAPKLRPTSTSSSERRKSNQNINKDKKYLNKELPPINHEFLRDYENSEKIQGKTKRIDDVINKQRHTRVYMNAVDDEFTPIKNNNTIQRHQQQNMRVVDTGVPPPVPKHEVNIPSKVESQYLEARFYRRDTNDSYPETPEKLYPDTTISEIHNSYYRQVRAPETKERISSVSNLKKHLTGELKPPLPYPMGNIQRPAQPSYSTVSIDQSEVGRHISAAGIRRFGIPDYEQKGSHLRVMNYE